MEQDDFHGQIARVVSGLETRGRADRLSVYRFARELVRTAIGDPATPPDRRARTTVLLALEAAIRDFERAYRRQEAARRAEPPLPPPETSADGRAGGGLGQVMAGLVRRDIRLLLARDRFAYLWMFVAPVLTIAVHFWAYVFILGLGSVLDMPTLPFLVLGIGGWHMMRTLTLRLGTELARERHWSRLYRVDALTVALAKGFELAFAYTGVVALALAWLTYAEGYEAPRNLLGVAFYWSLLAIAGFGAGLVLSLLREFLPGLANLAMPVFRIGFFFSGVVLVSEQFPERFRVFLVWNPVLHIMQLLRTEYFVEYRSVDASPLVAGFYALTVLFLGCAVTASRRRGAAVA